MKRKPVTKKQRGLDFEFYLNNLFRDAYPDEKSRLQAVKEAMQARSFFRKQFVASEGTNDIDNIL